MRVSLIIPVFNESRTLPGLLDSLAEVSAEVVFVDGGSTDGSTAIIRAAGYPCIPTSRSRAAQMNAGAAAARGEVLVFHHADSRLPRGAVGQLRRAVEEGAVGGSFDVRLDSRRPLLRLVGALITLRSRLTSVSTGDQTIFVRRDVFATLGGFARLPLFEDIDMSRRLRRFGPTARLRPPVVTSARRWERHGALRTVLRMWWLRLLYYAGVSPERLARHYGPAR